MSDYFDKITKEELEEQFSDNDVILSDQSELRYRMLVRQIQWWQVTDEHIRWIRRMAHLVKHLGIFDETEFRAIWLHTGDYELFRDEFEKDRVWVKNEHPGISDGEDSTVGTSISLVFWFTLRNNVTLYDVMTAMQQLCTLLYYGVPETTNLSYFIRFTDTRDAMDAIPLADYKIINSLGQWKFKENLNAINGIVGKDHAEFVFFEKLCNIFSVPITYEQYRKERHYIQYWKDIHHIHQSDNTFKKTFEVVYSLKDDIPGYYGKYHIGRQIDLSADTVVGLMWKYAVSDSIVKLLPESFNVTSNHINSAFDTDLGQMIVLAQHHGEDFTTNDIRDFMTKTGTYARELVANHLTIEDYPSTSDRMKFVEDLISKIEYNPSKLKDNA